MLYEYMKQLVENGEGLFTVCRIGAETEEALNVKRDMYLADDWQVATKDEYDQQFVSVGDPDNIAADEPASEPASEPTVVPEPES